MARTTIAEVREVLVDIDSGLTDLSPFVDMANRYVTDTLGSSGLATATLADIERYVAAHMVCITDPKASKEKTGDGEVTYEGKSKNGASGLASTSHGRMAITLDTTGKLASSGRRKAFVQTILSPDLT